MNNISLVKLGCSLRYTWKMELEKYVPNGIYFQSSNKTPDNENTLIDFSDDLFTEKVIKDSFDWIKIRDQTMKQISSKFTDEYF